MKNLNLQVTLQVQKRCGNAFSRAPPTEPLPSTYFHR